MLQGSPHRGFHYHKVPNVRRIRSGFQALLTTQEMVVRALLDISQPGGLTALSLPSALFLPTAES